MNPAELYVGLASQSGTALWMDPNTHLFVSTVAPVYSGPLPSFGPTTAVVYPDVSALAPGRYWWFAIVDNDANGTPDVTLFDYIGVTIQ